MSIMSFQDINVSQTLQETKTASLLGWLGLRLVPYLFLWKCPGETGGKKKKKAKGGGQKVGESEEEPWCYSLSYNVVLWRKAEWTSHSLDKTVYFCLLWTEYSPGLDVDVDLKVFGKEFECVPCCTPGCWLLHGYSTFTWLVQTSVIYMAGKTKLSFS